MVYATLHTVPLSSPPPWGAGLGVGGVSEQILRILDHE